LLVAAEEAAIAVVRAAHSQFIVEGSDAGIGILDRRGQLLAQAAATSILHSGGIVEQLQAIVEDIPIETMRPGDVLITNDPYRGGVHANDVMVCRPVFVDGSVEYFTASLIHVLDLGGSAHGGINASALETFEEGLQLPPLHWERAGQRNEDLVRLIALNSRSPAETVGDIDALVAGTLVAAQRLEAMISEHGPAFFAAIVARYLDATEAWTRREIAGIDDGSYRGRAVIDDDGINPGRSYGIEVEVRVAGDAIELDFAGTSPQVRAPINSSASQAYDAAMFAVRCFLDKNIPTNSGSFRPVTAHFPRGSLLNPDPPNPCGGRMMAVYAIVDAIIEALSAAVPAKRIARSGILQGFSVAGIGGAYWLHNSYDFGGVGARVGHDGVDATGLHFGVGRNGIPQVEPVERRCRLRVEAVELIVDSGGAGEWRGGLGARTTFRLLDDCLVSVRTDRFRSPPEGIDGGHAARAGAFYRVTPDGTRVDIGSKAVNVRLDRGDAFVMETSGGGGVGDPRRRSRSSVAADLRAGKISQDAAEELYGYAE
jgi:N-methylhydantoinase B